MSTVRGSSSWTRYVPQALAALPDDHPAKVAARTYALALSLALGPALLPFLTSRKARENVVQKLVKALRKELAVNGFACAMTVGVGGGAALQSLWDWLAGEGGKEARSKWLASVKTYLASVDEKYRTIVSNVISSTLAVLLFQSRRQRSAKKHSPTLDLTFVLFVRAADSVIQAGISKYVRSKAKDAVSEKQERRRKQELQTNLDALLFWAASARIMWCFFYQPERLPRSYNRWIMTLANIDPRILAALRTLRTKEWSYRRNHSTQPDLVSSFAHDLGYPAAWGDVTRLPAYGGPAATETWKQLGVRGRDGLGGLPCELVHANVTGGSCVANAGYRGLQAFLEAIALYAPVHILPIALSHPHSLLSLPNATRAILSILRSASFLSTFVASIWSAVCLTRTVALARLFPWVSHDFWDGPLGCTFAGSLVCGASIWIEQGHRRGEIALYVAPKALRACLPERWLRSGNFAARLIERIIFVLSLTTLLSAGRHRPDALRGLAHWTVAFVMKGSKSGLDKPSRKEKTPAASSGLATDTVSAQR